MNARNAPQRLVNVVQLFRIRVAAAESRLKVMREQAREAKRRRKEAKRLAQAARKRFKRSKTELSELREALAQAEAKLFQAGGRALARRKARAKPITKTQPRLKSPPHKIARREAAPIPIVAPVQSPGTDGGPTLDRISPPVAPEYQVSASHQGIATDEPA